MGACATRWGARARRSAAPDRRGRPRRHRAAQRAGDGGGLSRHRGLCHRSPAHPAYRADEFAFYLGDLGAKALILEAGADGPAVEAAARTGCRSSPSRRSPARAPATFSLDIPSGAATQGGRDSRADAALVLHTSGTTSRPKIVPLTGANLCASARNIADWLSLTPGDRCLNIMPLFHIHGLMAGVLASLHAGGTVICTPGFNALASSDGWTGWRPPGSPPYPPCTRRSSRGPRATAR